MVWYGMYVCIELVGKYPTGMHGIFQPAGNCLIFCGRETGWKRWGRVGGSGGGGWEVGVGEGRRDL
jgi:hypothetical protein